MRRISMTPEMLATRELRRRKMIAVIPSLLTIGNAVCGFGCITYAAKVGPESAAVIGAYGHLHLAALMIFGAIVLDGLDGPIARLAKQTSEFGAQLDSLADAISFGVAPAFLMLKFSDVFHPRVQWGIAVLYMLCAVLRLARYNVMKDDEQFKGSFCGLPSPAAAGTVASIVLIGPGLLRFTRPEANDVVQRIGEILLSVSSFSLPIVVFVVACLMVSRVRYPRLGEMLQGKRSYRHLVHVIFLFVAVLAAHELAIPLIFLYFVVGAPVSAFWQRFVLRKSANAAPVAETTA